MITSLVGDVRNGHLRASVCIIGSGAAGTSLALALSRAGVDVILLEAGGSAPTAADRDTLTGDLTHAPDHDGLDRIRQRRLGGTTAQWGGRCFPLGELDFEARAWVPGSGWPFGADELRRWYQEAAQLLRLGAFEWTISESTPGAEPFLVSPGGDGPLTDDAVWRWSPPLRFWKTFRARLRVDPRIQMVERAPVTRLVQDRPGGPVVEAIVRGPGGQDVGVRARSFVVAAGGLETARLLLSSDAVTSGGIGNSGDQLGRHYMIHPLGEVANVTLAHGVRATGAADFAVSRDGVYVRRMLRLSDDAQRMHQLRNIGFALWYPDPRDPGHGDGLLSAFALVRRVLATRGGFKGTGIHRRYAESGDIGAHLGNLARDLPRVAAYSAYWARRRWLSTRTLPSFTAVPRSGSFRLRFDAEQSPEPENRVSLVRNRDCQGMRRLAVYHHVGRDDRESMVRSLRLVADSMEAAGRARVVLPHDEVLMHETAFGDATHQMGTARMSPSPRTGVVDADCRVHDSSNLFLAGSAVFPTGGMAGPTMTIVALALRLADTLAREHATASRLGSGGERR